jgi:hypothetical protein
VQSLGRANERTLQKRDRPIATTAAARQHLWSIAAALTVGAFTVVFAPIRGRFHVNITALIAIRITGSIADIAIDLVTSARVEALPIATDLSNLFRETAGAIRAEAAIGAVELRAI